ncbi:hypothetical protein BC941DRAFT_417139, partial [Chlamydoabsidia padenii]
FQLLQRKHNNGWQGTILWRNSLATLLWKWWKNYKVCWRGKLLMGILGYNIQILLWRLLTNSS